MKELNKVNKDRLSVVVKRQQESKHQYIGTIKPYRGHTLFEFNKVSKEIAEAEFEHQDIHFNTDVKKMVKRRKVVVKGDCFYLSALNKKNAIKKLQKLKLF